MKLYSLPKDAALIIIDVQKGFDNPKWGKRNNPNAEKNMAKLLNAWRNTKRPIFYIQHDSVIPNSPLKPNQEGWAIKDMVKPLKDEPVIHKSVNSAFIGTDLKERLEQANLKTLVIIGLTTDHCVSTTARMGGNFGFNCYVVSDATATFDRRGYDGKYYSALEMHEVGLASLNGEFAQVLDTTALLKMV